MKYDFSIEPEIYYDEIQIYNGEVILPEILFVI